MRRPLDETTSCASQHWNVIFSTGCAMKYTLTAIRVTAIRVYKRSLSETSHGIKLYSKMFLLLTSTTPIMSVYAITGASQSTRDPDLSIYES